MSTIQTVTANRTWDKLVKQADDALTLTKAPLPNLSGAAKLLQPGAVEVAKGAMKMAKVFAALRTIAEVVDRQVKLNVSGCKTSVAENRQQLISDFRELSSALEAFAKTPLGRSSKELAQLAWHTQQCMIAAEGALVTSPTLIGTVVEGTLALASFAKAGEAKANLIDDLPALILDRGASLRSLERLLEATQKFATHAAPVVAQCVPDFRPNPNR